MSGKKWIRNLCVILITSAAIENIETEQIPHIDREKHSSIEINTTPSASASPFIY
jgi:hypothetical protein